MVETEVIKKQLKGTPKQIVKTTYVIDGLLKKWSTEDHSLFDTVTPELLKQHESNFWLDNRFKSIKEVSIIMSNKQNDRKVVCNIKDDKYICYSDCDDFDRKGNYPYCSDMTCSGRKDYKVKYNYE